LRENSEGKDAQNFIAGISLITGEQNFEHNDEIELQSIFWMNTSFSEKGQE